MSSPVPKELLEGVIRVFDPVEVWLFGSHARGDTHEDSDIDLFVVVDDEKRGRINRGAAIAETRSGYSGAVDLILTTQSGHQRDKQRLGTLSDLVIDQGVRLYGR